MAVKMSGGNPAIRSGIRSSATGAERRPRDSASASPLTTTSYAILGVLALKPRTAYELAVEMRHCFEYFWPRADARVYADAKALAKRGLIAADLVQVGRRRRTTYTITPAGREALASWLTRPPKPVALEFEALVKVYLARFGTREQLLATLAHTRDDAEYMLRVATNVRQVYLEGCAPLQDEYVHVWAFVYDFLVDYFQLLHRWAERAGTEVAQWPDLAPEGKREHALEHFQKKRPARWLTPDLAPGGALPPPPVPALPGMWARRHGR